MYLLVFFSNLADKNDRLYLHVLGKKELQISSLSPPLIYLVVFFSRIELNMGKRLKTRTDVPFTVGIMIMLISCRHII